MTRTRPVKLLLATAALGLAAAAPASADSIAYLRGGDVWLAPTDASREFQVTATGGYSSVAQADDGTLVAVNAAKHIVRMDRLGNVLSEIDTLVSTNLPGSYVTYEGPFDVDVSPSGQRIAYGYVSNGLQRDYDGNYSVQSINGTAFTSPTEMSSWTAPGTKNSKYYDAPQFVDDENLVVSNGPGGASYPIASVVAGSGDSHSWFRDGAIDPIDGTMSRSKTKMAFISGAERTELKLYTNGSGQLGGSVDQIGICAAFSDPAGFRYESPTFNADGSKLIWGSGKGLYIATLDPACVNTQEPQAVLPGASSPDWGPADVPTSRPLPAAGGGGGKPGGQPGGGGGAAGALGVKVAKVKRSSVRRKGIRLTVTAPAAGKVTGVATAKGKTVAKGSAVAAAPGAVALKLKVTKAGKRALKRVRSVRITVKQGQTKQTTTVKVGK